MFLRALFSCLGGVAGSNLSEFIPNILKRELYPYMYIYIFLSIHDLIASNSVQSKLQGLTINKKYMGLIRSCFMDILLKKLTINWLQILFCRAENLKKKTCYLNKMVAQETLRMWEGYHFLSENNSNFSCCRCKQLPLTDRIIKFP